MYRSQVWSHQRPSGGCVLQYVTCFWRRCSCLFAVGRRHPRVTGHGHEVCASRFFSPFAWGTTTEDRDIHRDIAHLGVCTVPRLGSGHELCQILGNLGPGCGQHHTRAQVYAHSPGKAILGSCGGLITTIS